MVVDILRQLRQDLAAAFHHQHLKKAAAATAMFLMAQELLDRQILAAVAAVAGQARQATVHPALAVLAS